MLLRIFAVLSPLIFCASLSAGVTDWQPLITQDGQYLFESRVEGHDVLSSLSSRSTNTGIVKSFMLNKAIVYRRGEKFSTDSSELQSNRFFMDDIEYSIADRDIKLNRVLNLSIEKKSPTVILGLGFLNAYVIQLDYPNKRYRLIDHNSVDLDEVANVKLKHDGIHQVPMIEVTLNNETTAWLCAGTQYAGHTRIQYDLDQEHSWSQQFEGKSCPDCSGPVDMLKFTMPSLTIGPFELGQVPVIAESQKVESADPRTKRGGLPATCQGTIGLEILNNFVVTLDYKNELLNIDLPSS